MKKVNILYFEPSTGYGGSSRCLLAWLRYLDRAVFNPVVVAYFNGPAIKNIKDLGVKVIKLPYINLIKKLSLTHEGRGLICYLIFIIDVLLNILPVSLLLALVIKLKKIEIIHINANVVFGIPGILASKMTKTPCICHIHETRHLNKKERFFAKWVDKFVVLTNGALDLYSKDIAKDKLKVVYNGIDLKEFNLINDNEKYRRKFNLNGINTVVGIVGRIAAGKGHDDFVESAITISKTDPTAKFLIVGSSILIDKNIEQKLRREVEKAGLTNNIIFTGWVDDVKQIMSLLDILVFPSSTFPEGFPLTCIEAMALSKPVIATNIPGPSEVVLDGISGYLVPPANPDVLTKRITELKENPLLAKKMGEAGRKRVGDLFDIKIITKQIQDIYFSTLNGGGAKLK